MPALGLTDPVRVCDTCHYKITTGNASSVVANSPIAVGGNVINTNNNNAEDDDLQRAIEASLRLSTGGGYQNQRSGFNEKSVKFAEPKAKSSDDDGKFDI